MVGFPTQDNLKKNRTIFVQLICSLTPKNHLQTRIIGDEIYILERYLENSNGRDCSLHPLEYITQMRDVGAPYLPNLGWLGALERGISADPSYRCAHLYKIDNTLYLLWEYNGDAVYLYIPTDKTHKHVDSYIQGKK